MSHLLKMPYVPLLHFAQHQHQGDDPQERVKKRDALVAQYNTSVCRYNKMMIVMAFTMNHFEKLKLSHIADDLNDKLATLYSHILDAELNI